MIIVDLAGSGRLSPLPWEEVMSERPVGKWKSWKALFHFPTGATGVFFNNFGRTT
jgi:hypothetical protein